MWLLYNILAIVVVILAVPVFFVRLMREQGFGRRWRQSIGFLPSSALEVVGGKACIWIHAASVGEIVAASPIVRELRRQMPGRPILVSAVTTAGYAMANRIMVEADAVVHYPIDLPWVVSSVIKRIKPAAFVVVETELWPNFLRKLADRSIPIVMVNGRISDRSVKRYGYLGRILRDILHSVTLFCMQSALDAEHIKSLGADSARVVVTGNTKFDQTYSEVSSAERNEIYHLLGFDAACPVVIAGSTHPGEEAIIASAFHQVKEKYPNVQLVLAPRQIMRAAEVEALLKDQGWTVIRRTAIAGNAELRPDVVLLDTIGELGRVYSIGDIIFVGGSLIPQGGHNVLEPAAHAKPVLVGPHMFNFKESYALLSERGACLTINDAEELANTIITLLADEVKRRHMGENAQAVIKENQGASARSAAYIKEILEAK